MIVVRTAQDVRTRRAAVLAPYLATPADGTTVVLQHAGGAKGKAVLEAARKAKALEIGVHQADPARRARRLRPGRDPPQRRADRAGRGRRAASTRWAATCASWPRCRRQLVSDSGGEVDVDLVRAYHRGRAEVSGFAVSDLAVVGTQRAGARGAALRAVGRGAARRHRRRAGRRRALGRPGRRRPAAATPYELAKRLGMPPWKVKRAAGQARGWSEAGLRRALGVVADAQRRRQGCGGRPGIRAGTRGAPDRRRPRRRCGARRPG